jgi:hypothetical protein
LHLQKNKTNISAYNDAFGLACVNGHLEVAQWLLQIKPNINISAENEYAFYFACFGGHLEVAQWLLQVKPTIDISACEAFYVACKTEQLHVLQWLHQVN